MKIIPIPRDSLNRPLPSFSVTVPLFTIRYTLHIHWNSRAAIWACTIELTDRGIVAAGLPMRADELVYSFAREGLPPGFLYLADRSRQRRDPGRYDLGVRVPMYFLSAEELP